MISSVLVRSLSHRAAVVAMLVTGCSEVEPAASRADASVVLAADGGAEASSREPDDTQIVVSEGDAAAAGPNFEIAFSASECQEECPAYDLKLDQTGSVLFYGQRHTRLQGWFGKMVSPEVASELLKLIVAAHYWELRDAYRVASDGCREVEPKRETHTWNVSMAGPAKIVVDYQGCQGVQETEELRNVSALLIEKLGLASYL